MRSLESNASLSKRQVAEEVGGEVLSLIEDPRIGRARRTQTANGRAAYRRRVYSAQRFGICIFFWSYVEYKLKLAWWA